MGSLNISTMKYLDVGSLLCLSLCLTVAQGAEGCGNCVFPFYFHNRIHDRCTTYAYGDRPWCLTEDGRLEYCSDPSCPGMAANPEEAMTPHPLNVANPGVCYCGLPNRKSTTSRIVGGDKTDNGEYPWQVALLRYGTDLWRQNCGGALVGSRYVITAAHCTVGLSPGDLFVRVGDTTLDEEFEAKSFTFDVANIVIHPDYIYNDTHVLNDIAVVELASVVPLDKYPHIKPACLLDVGASFPGDAVVTGWGSVNADTSSELLNSWLHEVDLTVFPDDDCGLRPQLSEDQICAGVREGGKSSCVGDSGGPLVASDPMRNGAMSLIGVVSFGSSLCGNPDRPSIFAKVSHFTKWLNQQMSDFETCPPPASTSPTTPPPITTTTPPNPTMEPAPECHQNKIPKLKVYKRTPKIKSWTECRDRCSEGPECEYFKWKKNICHLMTVDWKAKNSWVSGEKYCE